MGRREGEGSVLDVSSSEEILITAFLGKKDWIVKLAVVYNSIRCNLVVPLIISYIYVFLIRQTRSVTILSYIFNFYYH